MELRVLRYFLAIAREGSITKAAEILNVTQPTLSRQIKNLEDELSQQLFIRSSHNVSLTAEGMVLRKRAEEILDLAHKAKLELHHAQDTTSGEIYIGGGETHGMRLIAKVIKDMQKHYPKVRFHLYSGNAENVTERLDKGLVDFGILIQPSDLSKYDSISLPVKDIWGVIMPKDCELAHKKSITKKDLIGLPLICSQQGIQITSSHNQFINWFGSDFNKLNIVATYNLVYNAALLAEQGVGYVLSLDKLIDNMDNHVCFRPLAPSLESNMDIVWKKYQFLSPAAKIFLNYVSDYLERAPNPLLSDEEHHIE